MHFIFFNLNLDTDGPSSTEIDVSVSELSDKDLHEVSEKAYKARDKWYEIGLGLRIHVDKLEAIKKDYAEVDTCFREMLTYWLRQPDLNRSWSTLAQSLKGHLVDRPDIARQLTS